MGFIDKALFFGGNMKTLSNLERKREQLYNQLQKTGDFRRGTVSVIYRKCGKKNYVWAAAP